MAPKIDGRSMIIDLKNHNQRPYANPTKYPLAFPRPEMQNNTLEHRVLAHAYGSFKYISVATSSPK